MIWYGVWVVLGGIAAEGIVCPEVTCGLLDENVCAMRSNGFILNSNSTACINGGSCSLQNVLAWYIGSEATLACTQTVPQANSTVSAACPARAESKSFRSGATLVFCESDADCVLQDGTNDIGSCQCVLRMDKKAVCQPNPSSNLYWEFWSECGGSNEITDEKEMAYWNYYMKVWALTQSNNTCVNNLNELRTLYELYHAYVSKATVLLLAFGGLLT